MKTIMYAAGPGDIVSTYKYWEKGEDDPHQFAVTYSGQFLEVCKQLNLKGILISSNNRKDKIVSQQFIVKNLPRVFKDKNLKGIIFILARIIYGLRIVSSALKHRVNSIIIAEGTSYWFVFSILSIFGIKIIPSIHCTIWAQNSTLSRKQKLILKLEGYALRNHSETIIAVSKEIEQQLIELGVSQNKINICSLPKYRQSTFCNICETNWRKPIFDILYVGRIEIDKGVTDLIEMASLLKNSCHKQIRFNLCGEGSATELVKNTIIQKNLSEMFELHGHCNKEQLSKQFENANAVIVPTRSTFIEGLNKVVIEGVLASRPVITSRICPAMNIVIDAVIEAQPDNIDSYCDAINRICLEESLYQEKLEACKRYQYEIPISSRTWDTLILETLT